MLPYHAIMFTPPRHHVYPTTPCSPTNSFEAGGLDADLTLCAVLTTATPAQLANFSEQGKDQVRRPSPPHMLASAHAHHHPHMITST
jgi:hypothetical protein